MVKYDKPSQKLIPVYKRRIHELTDESNDVELLAEIYTIMVLRRRNENIEEED